MIIKKFSEFKILAIIFKYLAIIIICNIQQAYGKEVFFDRITAVVLDQPILHSQVINKVKKGPLVVVSDYPSTKSQGSDYTRALNDAVNLELIASSAREFNIEVTPEEIDDYINRIVSEQNSKIDDLKIFLADQNISFDQYKQDLSRQILLQKFSSMLNPGINQVSEQELKERYFSQYKKNSMDVSYEIEQWKITKNFYDEIYKLLSEANDKNTLNATSHLNFANNLSSKVSYMELGKIELTEINQAIADSISKLKPMQLSQPLELFPGYFSVFRIKSQDFQSKTHYLSMKPSLTQEIITEKQLLALQKWLKQQHSSKKIFIVKKLVTLK